MISIPGNWSGFSQDDLDRMPLADLQLPVRVHKRLEYEGVHTIGDLMGKSPHDLLAIYGFGRTGLQSVRQKLADHGLRLRGDAWMQ
jgi:DNA-directed RNA polymerase subunit alpha